MRPLSPLQLQLIYDTRIESKEAITQSYLSFQKCSL